MQDRKIWREQFQKGGLTGPLNWYKMASRALQTSDGLGECSSFPAHPTLRSLLAFLLRIMPASSSRPQTALSLSSPRSPGPTNTRPDISVDMLKVKKPYLYIGGTSDYVCRPELQDRDMKKVCADLRIEVFEGVGHWLQLELPERVNQTIEGWAEEKGLVGK